MEKLVFLPGLEHPREIGELFREYTQMLLRCDPGFQKYLDLQNYDHELEELAEKYGPPDGRLYLAVYGGASAGCVALRRLDAERCELKRLYVRPAFRGLGIGGALTARVLADAREIGYARMMLDTMPALRSAQRMYRGLGFVEIPRYNDSPMDDTIYMEKTL